ncbi:MAG: hypothetical protein V3S55_15755 [Nitrospiraceae bacterium]
MRRVADLKGPGSKVAMALTELFPTFDVENLQPELFLLGGQLLAMGAADRTSAVGLFKNIQIANPVGSGKILTVTSAWVSVVGNDRIFWSTRHGIFANLVVFNLSRDTRVIIPELPTGQIRDEDSAGTAFNNGIALLAANTPFHLTDPNGLAVLAPGGTFTVGNGTTNRRLVVTFYWKERVAEPSELNF